MSIIVKFAEDRFVQFDVREVTAEEAESADAPVVDRSATEEESAEETTGGRGGRRIPRLLAVGGAVAGVAYALRKLRGGDSITEEIEIETEKSEAEN